MYFIINNDQNITFPRHCWPLLIVWANEEKVQSMLNRFLTFKNEEKKKPKERHMFLASECRDLTEVDKWRQQII
jgi:hypothetical protein